MNRGLIQRPLYGPEICQVGGLSGRRASKVSAHAQETNKDARQKVSMVSLGCPKNTVDGEVLLGDLYRSGFDVTDNHEESDAIVVNTCGFVEDAKADSIENIIQAAALKGNGKVKKVIVTGCLAQRYNDELADQMPEIDLVMGFENYGNLSASLKQVLGAPPEIDEIEYQNRARVQVGESTVGFRPEWDRFRLTPRHTAYLRVAEGCNHACTFCAIPGFRYVYCIFKTLNVWPRCLNHHHHHHQHYILFAW